jgi:hypothetical protein
MIAAGRLRTAPAGYTGAEKWHGRRPAPPGGDAAARWSASASLATLAPTISRHYPSANDEWVSPRFSRKIIQQLAEDGRARRSDVVQNLQADAAGYSRDEIDDMIVRMHTDGLINSIQGPYSTVTVT